MKKLVLKLQVIKPIESKYQSCILTIVDNKTNKKICINFDIVNYVSYGCEFAHILFYDANDKSRKKYIDMIAFGCSPIGVLGFFYFSEI